MTSQVLSQNPDQVLPSLSSFKTLILMDDVSECLLGIASAIVSPFSTLIGASIAVLDSMTKKRITLNRITPDIVTEIWNNRIRSLSFSGVLAAGLFCKLNDSDIILLRPLSAGLLGYCAVSAFYRHTTYFVYENSNTPAHTPPE